VRTEEKQDWCAGHNPPSVQRRHSAKRATRACGKTLISAYSPFHPAGQSFHRFHPAYSTTVASSPHAGRTFRFCSVASALALRLCRRCRLAWWAEFPQTLNCVRKPSASSPTHKYNCALQGIRILEQKISIMWTTSQSLFDS